MVSRNLLDSCWPGGERLLASLVLRRRRFWHMFSIREEFKSVVVRSSNFGGVVPLRFGSSFVFGVSISDVLVLDDAVADISIVVVAYIDTAVAKVMMEYWVFWRLVRPRSSTGGGGFGARLFIAASPR